MHQPRRFSMVARRAILMIALCAGPAASIVHAASGSDVVAGLAGYRWRDVNSGAVAEPASFDGGVFTAISPPNDLPINPIALPFNFPFYGTLCNTITLTDNGWMGLSGPYANTYPAPAATIPDNTAPNGYIAPFWDQLRSDNAIGGLRIRYGIAVGGQAFEIDTVATQVSSGATLLYRVYLYRSGMIRMQYVLGGRPLTVPTIGIENPAGTDGCRITSGGSLAPGIPATLPAQYVIELEPPPIFPTECASFTSVSCGSSSNLSLPGAGPTFVGAYGCPAAGNDARERVVSFTIAQAATVGITAAAGTARNLRMYLLGSCNERDCISGPATSVSLNLGPGTYYVAVDAAAITDEGTYTLTITCNTIGSLTSCGSTVSGTTVGGRSFFPSYPCAGSLVLTGRETYYQIDLPAPTNIRARLSGLSVNLDVLILAVGTGVISANDCVAWGDNMAAAFNVQGTYLIVVDGVAGATGAFTLDVDCGVELNCGSPDGTVNFAGPHLQRVSGDTTGGTNAVIAYACEPGTIFDGPELVYALDLPQPGQVIALQTGGTAGLSFFVLDSCNEGACLATGCGSQLSAGRHYLVVDGSAGAAGPFDVSVIFEPQFNRWDTCEPPCVGANCTGTTLITDTVSTFWNFDDGAFCYSDPASHNYPNGCTFAMYVVVDCGTAMHIPLFDVESCHMRIFDVFRGVYVPLSAVSTGGWSANGIDIQWQDCAGTDFRWNEQTTDISFQNPTGLCGLFRLEFVNHAGFVWELFANCTGARLGEFNIHDSLCGAFQEYAPLPNLGLVSASIVTNCPDATVTYTAINDGCGLAHDIPVTLFDNGVEVATDIIPSAPYGQTVTRSFPVTFAGPTTSVTLFMDPLDVIMECDEAGGVACERLSSREELPLSGCVPGACDITPAATATPSLVCSGTPVTIDASGSTQVNCTGGLLQYQLRDAGGIILPWRPGPIFPPQSPTQSTDYIVEARCASLPGCANSVPLRVDVERPPAFNPATVLAADQSSCNLGVRVSWGAATFFGPTGTGYYNVYRSSSSCADALTRAPIAAGITTLSFSDTNTSDGSTYYYVVEAEDATAATICPLRGPVVNGPSTRVDANGGTCQGITDSASPRPDLLPRVGGTLHLGGFALPAGRRYGNTFVDLDWTPDRPLNIVGGEHFHVLRSEDPASVVSLLVTEPPFLTLNTFRDANADDTVGNVGLHVWYYLVYVSDACENTNRGPDP
jgi:hypothetical protein